VSAVQDRAENRHQGGPVPVDQPVVRLAGFHLPDRGQHPPAQVAARLLAGQDLLGVQVGAEHDGRDAEPSDRQPGQPGRLARCRVRLLAGHSPPRVARVTH
jgi:hypothetical protein